MTINERNKRIVQLAKMMPLHLIAKKYGISYERVRQVTNGVSYKPDEFFTKVKTQYAKNVHTILKRNFYAEIKRLSQSNRKKETIIQKTILISTLKHDYGFTLNAIARLFNNDHTTILNLYNKRDKTRI